MHWRFTATPSGDRAVILGARLVTWDDVEAHRPGLAALSLARIEANGLEHFTSYHPALGYLAGGETGSPGQDGLCPPRMPVCPAVAMPPDAPMPPGSPAVVPEPATAALVGLGLLLIGLRTACRGRGR